MPFIRSTLHMLWMVLTVVPYTLAVLICKWTGGSSRKVYSVARAWLALSVNSARVLMGVSYRVQGMENLPTDPQQGVVLLCKHQSTYETFLMPAIMPRALAYVFKKELLSIPFFGWWGFPAFSSPSRQTPRKIINKVCRATTAQLKHVSDGR